SRPQSKLRRVLAPVCLQPHGYAGLEAAAGLAAAVGARLTVLYVAGKDSDPAESLRRLRLAVSELPPRVLSASRPTLQLSRGDPDARILREAGRHDLVAVCARPSATVERWLGNSTVERLLSESPCPVLVAPSPKPAAAPPAREPSFPLLDPANAPLF
ncbi:MAG: universal stress protein, partial [Elusimicrobia bacterium]|nr:universal stress protein [Elusimicrobiota bacterium]